MQNITVSKSPTSYALRDHSNTIKPSHSRVVNGPMIYGLYKSLVKAGIWINVMLLALQYYKSPVAAIKAFKNLKKLKNDFRGKYTVLKYAKTKGRYYFTFNAPGWPSISFNKYVLNNIKKIDNANNEVALNTIVFGITKKCGYQCEHCFEWEALNKPETLTREHLLTVVQSFQKTGITQVQLSGGEPLNRFDDIIYLLQNIKKSTDVWLYTSGYHLTKERSIALKQNGCTGIIVSLDHWIPELHNTFRGKKDAFAWAEKAVVNARENGLVVSLSVCATKDFISRQNLVQYAELAKRWGVSFIQVLEPKAVGHYYGKDIYLTEPEVALLENFYKDYNYNKKNHAYPSIVYHGFYSRRVACGGGANHYVYVDTDGDVHNCPFCQKKMFSALHENLEHHLRLMAAGGCNVFTNSTQTK